MEKLISAKNVCVCVLLSLFSFTAIGQVTPAIANDAEKAERKQAKKAYKAKMLSFKMDKHREMDAKFSKSDLKKVKKLRAKAKTMRDAHKNAMKAVRETAKKDGADRMEMRGKMLSMKSKQHDEKMTLMNELKPILERNKEMLETIGAELKTQAKAQREIAKSEMGKNAPSTDKGSKATCGTKGAKCGKKKGKRGKGKRGAKAHSKEGKGAMKMARFVLWDGTVVEKKSKAAKKRKSKSKADATIERPDSKLRNFPNPASDVTSVEFELPKEASFVTLQISDLGGNLVRKVNYGQMTAGSHTVDVRINDLAAGTYTYTITTDNHQETKKMSIAR